MSANIKRESLLRAGKRIIDLINQNINKEIDIEGNAFTRYSPRYRAWKAKKYPQDAGKVNLTITGHTRRSLAVIIPEENTIKIGFENTEAAQLAYYHNISGAGRSRVLRRFLGLRDEQWQDKTLLEIIAEGVVIEQGSLLP